MLRAEKNPTKRKATFLAAALAVVLASASTGYAMLPGESAAIISTMWQIHGASEQTKYAQYMDIFTRAKESLAQMTKVRNMMEEGVTGKWRDPFQVLRSERSRIVALGGDFRSVKWRFGGDDAEAVRSPVMQNGQKASETFDRVIRDGGQADAGELRGALETLYEAPAPTQTGARSEAAMKDMAETIAFMGQLQQAIKEELDASAEAKELATQGGLSESEVQRLQVVAQTSQARAQALTLQMQMYGTRLQINSLGYQVAAANARDKADREERYNRVSALNAFQAAPGAPTVGAAGRRLN